MYIYEFCVDDEVVKTFSNKEKSYNYLAKEYNFYHELEYQSYNNGEIEQWSSEEYNIYIIEKRKDNFSLENLFKNIDLDSDDNKKNIKNSKPIIVKENKVTTPKRTRTKKNNKAGEGKTFIDEDGNKWYSKKTSDGYKWEKEYEKTYDTKKNVNKRKSPKEGAKLFEEGTIKEGLDGNNWKVIKDKKGNYRWSKLGKD